MVLEQKLGTVLEHRTFKDDEFWKEIPIWKDVTKEEFADFRWQQKNSIRKFEQVKKALGDRLSDEIYEDMLAAQKITPMNVRITPYIFSLINWDNPIEDPLRKQFLPIASQYLPDHPYYKTDSLSEDTDSPVEHLTHRYADKVLFLTTTLCPVYCSYCTRSRIIGGSTENVEKESFGANLSQWDKILEYIKSKPAIEDVVVSGGDVMMLTPKQLKYLGEELLNTSSIRRVRLATKGLSIFPQKILTDHDWFKTVVELNALSKSLGKEIAIHTHFSCTHEITIWTKMAMERLYSEGIIVRNQAVLQEGVNNDFSEMMLLTRKLSYINVRPYYVYLHDMVPSCEHFRTTLDEAVELEKAVRGTTAGFNTPTFVCDLPGGGGKRHVASYEYYDRENGISVWKAPNVKPGKLFTYFDPIHKLSEEAQKRWACEKTRKKMVDEAIAKVEV